MGGPFGPLSGQPQSIERCICIALARHLKALRWGAGPFLFWLGVAALITGIVVFAVFSIAAVFVVEAE